ncbi:uncharacterized protein LOC129590398 isoform X2 [Paramacrobiotus metropolitanus]|uniref:uncharacterized protein LOC129590398 isoform X2 n=1 Tax=Paramacrobiotus metropolitanus TaxID=2943436 RepID=UPI00244599E1|nr:uncharacterized protein LOC129590398 isoform X2 [Paramacrobiotus metropolitanus]
MERQESLPERRRLRPRSAIGENVVVSAKQPAKSKRRHQSTQKHSGPSSGGRQSPEFPELDLTNRSGVVPSNRITAVERPDRQLRRRNITDAQRQAIYGMFEQGSTGRKIAGTLGVQLYDVQRELLLVGKTLSGRSGSGRGMSRASNAKKQLVCQLFQEDLSMCVICDRVGLSMPTVSKILHLAGKDVKQRFLKTEGMEAP